jgi:valyl-tRNA synthetase
MPGDRGLLAVHEWPEVRSDLVDEEAEEVVRRVQQAVTALRRYRDDVGAPAGARIPARLEAEGYENTAEHVARLARFEFTPNGDSADGDAAAAVAVPGGAVQVLASNDIDPEEAARRVAAQRAQIEGEIKRAESKLANEKFVSKAPAHVVEAERDKLARYQAELERLSGDAS